MREGGAFKGPLPILLAIAAVIGWGFALYLVNARSSLQTELAQQNQSVGTLETLRGEVTALTLETDRISGERDAVGAGLAEQQQQLTGLQDQITAAESELEQKRSGLTEVEQQVAPLRAEIAGFDTARTEAEQRLSASTQELADVGERLTEARASEAVLRQQLSVLTDETARLTAGSSEAETRVQEARDAEASLQTTLTSATTDLDRITAERDALSQELQDMTQRRDLLAEDNAAATEQRQSVQAVIAQLSEGLAARSQQLAEVERRMAVLQARETPVDDSELTLEAGTYTVGPLMMTIGDDGGFVLRNETRGEEVTGTYAVNEGILTLSEASGDVGETPFPMTCALRQSADGLVLEQAGDQLCALAGLSLQAAE
jgi:predicted  nucleic acid-binding Zn-ribbon protein